MKTLPEPKLTYQLSPVRYTSERFSRKHSRYHFCVLVNEINIHVVRIFLGPPASSKMRSQAIDVSHVWAYVMLFLSVLGKWAN